MKQTHVLTAVCAVVSVLTSAQAAVAGEQGIENQQQAAMLEITASAQPMPPAEWRTDRYLAMPAMPGVENPGMQAAAQPMIPAEWRTDRYLAMPMMPGVENPGIRAAAQPMIPAEWRTDRYLAMPAMADARDHGIRNQEIGIGAC